MCGEKKPGNLGLNRIRTRDLQEYWCDALPSCEATHWDQGKSVIKQLIHAFTVTVHK